MWNFDTEYAGGGAVLRAAAPAQTDFAGLTAAPGFVMSFARNEEIYGEEEEADFVYRVVSGVVRTVRILGDGRRQVSGFYFPGDVFGLEPGSVHSACAEAVSDCNVAVVKRRVLDRAADRDAAAARALWSVTCRDLERLQAHMLLLGRKNALERVAAFLLEMAARGSTPAAVDLAMSRTDIADYLGMTIETVSRSLSQLERDGLIGLPSTRHVQLRDRRALAAIQG